MTPRHRWIGKRVYDIFCEEFYAYDKSNYYKNAINKGLITVNDKPICKDYVYQKHDRIIHTMHKHEPPVSCNDQDIQLAESMSDDKKYNLLVADKPASVPVHPVGRYRYNSLKWILNDMINSRKIDNTLGINHVFNAHRLDNCCSGLIIFTTDKTPKKYVKKLHQRFENNEINKMYLAKVLGDFQPDSITVNAPIGISPKKKKIENQGDEDDVAYIEYGVDMVNGKESITHFIKKHFDGKYSLIECYPKTGRSHQIRVHLQYIGFPVLNDVKYGGFRMNGNEYVMDTYVDDHKSTLQHMIMDHWDDNCVECQMILKQIKKEIDDPFDKTKQICLHSLHYLCPKDRWEFKTEFPRWVVK